MGSKWMSGSCAEVFKSSLGSCSVGEGIFGASSDRLNWNGFEEEVLKREAKCRPAVQLLGGGDERGSSLRTPSCCSVGDPLRTVSVLDPVDVGATGGRLKLKPSLLPNSGG
jgi:hypothetical protein